MGAERGAPVSTVATLTPAWCQPHGGHGCKLLVLWPGQLGLVRGRLLLLFLF